ncbi:hypothetical protein [Halorussus sp. AFM4]|uniref:hypothetical protein n=1 Tax=Halorussus sp. AFM4 TaxID=3421651 RepID=UPI003EBA902F
MTHEGWWHELVKLALDECLREFAEDQGIEARVATEETVEKHSQRKADNFVEFLDTEQQSPLAIEVESGVKTYPRIKTEITERFEYYQSQGLLSFLAADGYTLNGNDPTVEDTAWKFGDGIVEVEVDEDSVQLCRIDGMSGDTLSDLAVFMNDFTFDRDDWPSHLV